MIWTATIEYRDWDDKETICGRLGAITYHLRQRADKIAAVDLVPQHELADSQENSGIRKNG